MYSPFARYHIVQKLFLLLTKLLGKMLISAAKVSFTHSSVIESTTKQCCTNGSILGCFPNITADICLFVFFYIVLALTRYPSRLTRIFSILLN